LPLDGVEPRGVIPFTPAIALDYETYLATGTNRSVITSIRRSEMREILRNPHIQWSEEAVPNRAERARLYTLKAWTLKRFELDDQQIYRKAETSRGVSYNRRYAVCTWDSFELIARVHRGLHYAGTFSPLFDVSY
jgi:hypothetical protein